MRFDSKRQIKLAFSFIYYTAMVVFNFFLRTAGRTPRRQLTILYYHSVPFQERAAFARQMQALGNATHVVPASYRGALPPDRNSVAITFDDAFVSVLENALPEIAARSYCCTIFVPVGALGQHPTWAIEGNSQDRDELVMTPEQLKKLPADLVMLGSHSMTHPHLSQINPNHARDEIERSRRDLANITGRDIRLFAFPYGDHSPAVIDFCRNAGYEFVFTILPTSVNVLGSDFVRGRVKVEPLDSPLEFFLKSNGAYAWMSYVSRIKQRL